MVEPDQPKNPLIAVAVVATTITIVIVSLGIFQYFDKVIRTEVTQKQHAKVDDRLTKLRSMEESNLAGYSWVNKEQGVVRIPIDRAVELVVRDRNAPPPPPAPAAPEAPAAPAGKPAKAAKPAEPAKAEVPKPAKPAEAPAKPAAKPAEAPKAGAK